jgi:hypothetical protein
MVLAALLVPLGCLHDGQLAQQVEPVSKLSSGSRLAVALRLLAVAGCGLVSSEL